ncbi:MAG: UvrD-helicase domain-containing protein [Vicinamibacterales bacterium]
MRESKKVDAASRDRIRTDLLKNLLVEAGAGSGKTQMLAERMAAGVAEGVYAIEHMAAVTFTRKAASELRGRFHLALEARLHDARVAAQSTQAGRLEAALSNLERFFAGTIHSFCARLLRERPVESHVSPGFTELDEVQELELRKRVWREFITAARREGDPDVLALLDADVKPRDLDHAFARVCENEDVEFPPGDGVCPDPKAAAAALKTFWEQVAPLMPAEVPDEAKCKTLLAAKRFEGMWRVSRKRLARPSVVAELLDLWDRESTLTMKWWSEDQKRGRQIRDAFQAAHAPFLQDVVQPYLAAWRQYVYRLAISLLVRARAAAASERRRLNTLNYGDLLNLTARVLREDTDVRRALQRKYRTLLVDEFQDTDPVQAEIVFWLAEDPDAPRPEKAEPTDWRVVPLRPGALFVVGDPKQSIYRFRRADIDIYNLVRRRFEEASVGAVVPLTLNFRSGTSLCAWANDVFVEQFPVEPTEHAPRFAPLDPHPGQTETGEICTLSSGGDTSGEVLALDADRVAAFIRSEVDAGRRTYSDFLVLTRKKTNRIAPYAAAFEALNIPVEVSGAGAFGESVEVATVTQLLRALADPQDQLALVAVLRGPLFGISDPELFAYKHSGGWFSLFAGAEDDADVVSAFRRTTPEAADSVVGAGFGADARTPGSPKPTAKAASQPKSCVHLALQTLHRWYRWTRILPAAAALDRILEDSGYLALAATTPGGVDAGDLPHAVDRVRQVVELGGSLGDAVDALAADREATSEVESLPLEPGRTDVVRLMNLHKAKGLEANVVFLADPAGGVKPRVDLRIERDGLRARGWMLITKRSEYSRAEPTIAEHADWAQHEAAEQPYLEAEEDRLLYVAATRARQMLVVSRWTKKPADGPWGKLAKYLDGARELPATTGVGAAPAQPLSCSDSERAAAEAARAAAHAVVNQPSWSITSATAEAHHIATMTRAAEPAADDPSKVVLPTTPSHRADAGQAWGTLVHGMLEHAMRHEHVTRDDLRRLGMWLTVAEPKLREVLDLAVDTVLQVAKAGFWLEAKAAPHSVETPFAFAEAQGRLMNGVIDLMFEREGRQHVIDYKTDINTRAAADAYALQLSTYGRALTAVGATPGDLAIRSVRETDV